MNINPEFNNQDENPTADEVMANGMDFIFENLISPMADKLNQEQLKVISLIGISFKIIAEQATALEELESNIRKNSTDQDISQN